MKKYTENAVLISDPRFTAALLEYKDLDAVFVKIAVEAGEWYAPAGRDAIARVAASLLDEGTVTLSRDGFRAALEREGSQIFFWEDGRYVYASIEAAAKSLESALKLALDALSKPLVAEESVSQVIQRLSEEYIHESEDTGIESALALSRLLYTPGSALYMSASLETRKALETFTRGDIKNFMTEAYRGPVTVAAMGGITPEKLRSILIESTGAWDKEQILPLRNTETVKAAGLTESYVSISGKESVDVRLGGVIDLTAKDSDTHATRLTLDLLGGGFSDHLMQAIRDRDGLTYGTYARLKGREFGSSMYWFAAATFGNALFEKGIAALKKEFAIFMEEGITEKRIAEKIEEIEGRYAVMFAEPRHAVAPFLSGLLALGTPHDVDLYLEALHGLSVEEVRRIAHARIKADALAASGAIDEKGKLL